MANKPTERYEDLYRAGVVLPSELLGAYRDSSGALTGALRQKEFMDAVTSLNNEGIGNVFKGTSYSGNPTVPTIEEVSKLLGYSTVNEFVENFPKNLKEHKEEILRDPSMGESGWESVKNVYRQAVPYYEQQKARKEREEDVNIAQTLLLPRMTERYISGQPIRDRDAVLDVVENAAMALPVAGWTGKGIRATKFLSKVPKVEATASSLIGNSFVPLISEAADAAAYGSGEGMDDRANFSWGDVVMGSGINNAANYAALRGIGAFRRFTDPLDGGFSSGARDAVSEIGQTSKGRLNEAAERTRKQLMGTASAVASGEKVAGGDMIGFAKGTGNRVARATPSEIMDAKQGRSILNLIDEGKINPKDAKSINFEIKKGGFAANLENLRKQRALVRQLQFEKNPEKREAIKRAFSESVAVQGQLPPKMRPSSIMNLSEGVDSKMVDDAFSKNPDLYYNLFNDAKVKSDFGKRGVKEKVTDVLYGNVGPFVQNKLGKNSWLGSYASSVAPVVAKQHRQAEEEGRNVKFSNVIASAPEGSEERAFLTAVRDKPSVVYRGLGSGDRNLDSRFKQWLVKGGYRKILELDADIPLWEQTK